jgi:hypothetical protein
LAFFFSVPALAEDRLLQLPNGEELHYRVVTDPAESARETATQLLRHLASGDIAAAAALSNAPMRRYEVLRDYRDMVGEEEFRRVFARYQSPANRILLEAAIGRRRLIVWDLGEAGNHLVGQHYVDVDGKFLLDDEPNAERAQLTRLLEALRNRTTN